MHGKRIAAGHWTQTPGARFALLGPNGLLVDCPACGAPAGKPCNGPADDYCPERIAALDGGDA